MNESISESQVRAMGLEPGQKERQQRIAPGLFIYIRKGKKGITKTWRLEYRNGDKMASETIGTYESPKRGIPLMSVKDACKLAEERLDKIARQSDPRVLAVIRRLNLVTPEGKPPANFEELGEHWIAHGSASRLKDKGAEAASILRRHVFPFIGELPLSAMTPGMIDALLRKLHVDKGLQRTVGRSLGYIRAAVHYGLKNNWMTGDPTAAITADEHGGRAEINQRYLDFEELKLMTHLLEVSRMSTQMKLGFWLILSTGNRSDETLKAEVDQFDFETNIWTIPPELQKKTSKRKAKVGAPEVLPPPRFVNLSPFALYVVKELLKLNGGSKYLFPKNTSRVRIGEAKEGPASAGKLTNTLIERQTSRSANRSNGRAKKKDVPHEELGLLDLPGGHWSAHSLRKTFSSLAWAHRRGFGVPLAEVSKPELFSMADVDKCLSHQTGTVLQRIYILDQDRESMIRCWNVMSDVLFAVKEQAAQDEALRQEALRRRALVDKNRRHRYEQRSLTKKARQHEQLQAR